MPLKKQDLVVALKLLVLDGRGESWTFSRLSEALGLSPSELHGCVRRLIEARLVRSYDRKVQREALTEFMIHGAKYCFPARTGSMTRGLPTSYAAPPLRQHFDPGKEPVPVWPDKTGSVRGIELAPLYRTVPQAAAKDLELYELLALFDAIRSGNAREKAAASEQLQRRVLVGSH